VGGAPHRLTLRIYLVSLAQLAVIVGMTALVVRLLKDPLSFAAMARDTRAATARIRDSVGDGAALNAELARVRDKQHLKASVYDGAGQLLASNVTPPLPALSAHEISHLGLDEQLVRLGPPPHENEHEHEHEHDERGPGGGRDRVLPLLGVMLTASPLRYAVLEPAHPGPPVAPMLAALACALIVTGVSSVVLARSFAQPLSALSDAASKLGAGDLTARARLARRDEFGRLAQAFDDMAERIADLLRAQQELLANASHELRTPLARIRVALDLAAETDVVSAQEALGEIAEDLAELERLVNDVLQTARLDLAAGRAGTAIPALHTAAIDANAVIDKAAERFRSSHPGRLLELRAESGEQLIEADAVLLRRALDNLLDNAQKYSEPSTAVVVRTASLAGGFEISAQDFGIGIAEADLPRIGTPFFRGDRSRARRTGGIGLGLSLARRIVEAHGGGLDVRSEAGVGTTVRITLPKIS
jgi:signal transduction histidine kinase